ncbi:MAG: Fe-S cluster assembly protein SufD [Hyphomicrobiaceae bacterium]
MNVAVTKTRAEQALLQGFEQVAGVLPGAVWVRAAREKALGAVEALGLPHRRVEEWKYTDLRAALKEAFPPAVASAGKVAEPPSPEALAAAIGPELATMAAIRVMIRNGRFAGIDGAARLPAGVVLAPLAEALSGRTDEALESAFAVEVDAARQPVIALNTAYATDGVRLAVSPGVEITEPVHVVFLADASGPLAVTTRNVIDIGPGAKVTIVESHAGAAGVALQANTVTQINVGDGARVAHLKVIAEGERALHLGSSLVKLGADATYRAFELTAGVGLARNETMLSYLGENTAADVSGMALGRGSAHIDTTLTIDHVAPACESRELFKYVLDGEARGIFQGKVIVRPDAQKSDGKQMAQALMLSEAVEFDSKPELEIYADDVVCGHGSTVAEIEPDLVFYCRSRGIPLEEARALLIDSFIGEALEKVEDETLREAFAAVARRWLEA